MAICVEGVEHTFGSGETETKVLFDNNLDISQGEIVIMLGPSGSGKTTLLTLIGALRKVQTGRLQVMGRELSGLSPRQLVEVRRGIGFIFQAHNLFQSLTALQNVQLALELRERDPVLRKARAEELLTKLGLQHRLHYKPEGLSGGQRQRVAIARALANCPGVILADEPTAALDEESGRTVVTLLQEMALKERSTIMIVTHDNRILDVADRIVNMALGRIVSNVLVKEKEEIVAFLQDCGPFEGMQTTTLSNVAEKVKRERFPAGQVVFRQGDIGDKFYMIRRGRVEIIIAEPDRPEPRHVFLKEGDVFGEKALMGDGYRTGTVVAREPLEVYTLGKVDFDAALTASASLDKELRKIYAQRQ
jgi:putative ABC transport system ATP-binding protein